MIRLRQFLVLVAAISFVSAQDARVATSAPVKNYSVSFFSDAGYHRMRDKGGTADLQDRDQVRVEEMTLTLFSGEADRRVESVLIAPVAILNPENELVRGPEAVRLVRDDLELYGEDWSYDHRAREIHLRRGAHIIFNTSLADYLK